MVRRASAGIGYEVVGAPGKFFYSHATSRYNSEPLTHTGMLASYAWSEDTAYYGGVDGRMGYWT